METSARDEKIKKVVRETYGDIARRFVEEPARASCCAPSQAVDCCGAPRQAADCCSAPSQAADSCCAPSQAVDCCSAPRQAADCCSAPSGPANEMTDTATRFYSDQELADLPESVTNVSLGCGNPTAIAEINPGEVVLDLGSGGGIDCFLAAKKVGPEGRVIGLDMTPDMIKLARRNARKMGVTNVEFRFGEMEDIPLPDQSVDVIISNCVVNLSPDKSAVFGEAYRVLRPSGRVMVSDIVIQGELPRSVRDRLDAWAACVAGALDESDYLSKIRAAGFEDVEVLSRSFVKISEFAEWEGVREIVAEAGVAPEDLDITIASIKVKAVKPA
ncbi:MAG TPA: arsenite methyltransferase [Anaerolineae bacterium]|nr:arsenite methyltransferase [Anaerolineae bacterium]